jgi:hypothetical protein
VDVETLIALRTPEGQKLLADAVASREDDPFTVGTRLRRDHPADLVAAALTQAQLRHRALGKFAPDDACRMYFTVDGLEQATRATVAAHRTRRFATRGGPVADLCCGIGGDLIALTRSGCAVTGVDADPLTAAVAAANLEALGLAARVECADATSLDRRPFRAVMCDPARRTGRGRVFNPDAYQPPWSFAEELLRGTACVKVAPGIPHERVPPGVEAEWVSDGGEVKEAALWSGDFADDGVLRRATLLPSGLSVTNEDAPPEPPVGPVGRWLIEPDGAVIRAGLVTAVTAQTGGWLMDSQIAYIACDSEPRTGLGRVYAITDRLPYDFKRLRAYVRENHVGALTIKKRGVDVDPAALRRQLRPAGDNDVTFVITRVANRAVVLVATPAGAAGR